MKRIIFSIVAVILGLSSSISFVGCGGTSDSISKAKEMNADKFISKCEAVEYKLLKKNSDSYVDKKIKVEVRIEQDLDDGYYRAYDGNPSDEPENWYDNEYLITDVSDNGLDLSEGDAITIYGIYDGLSEVERALYDETDKIPEIVAIQTGELQSGAAIKNMVDSLVLKKQTDEWGDAYYAGEIENTTGIEFGSFGIDVNYLGANGNNVGSDSWYVDNWKPNQKAAVKFEYLPEGTEKIEITDTERYSD